MSVVGSTLTAGLSYADISELIRSHTARPLTLQFVSEPEEISVTFGQAGALGLKLGESERCGAVEVLSVLADTQAEKHPELRPGLLVTAVGERVVSSLGYEEVFHLMGVSSARPLKVRFATSVSRIPSQNLLARMPGEVNVHGFP